MPIEDVVPQDERDGTLADELTPNDECLSQALGLGLFGIAELDSYLASIAQESLEQRQVMGRADDQDFADPRQHQHRQRIIDHRLVIDGQ